MPPKYPGVIVVAPNTPDKSTKTFPKRPDRTSALQVTEAKDGDLVMVVVYGMPRAAVQAGIINESLTLQ